MADKADKLAMIGYVPLLYSGDDERFFDQHGQSQSQSQNSIKQVLGRVAALIDAGVNRAQACAWIYDDNHQSHPVFVISQADEIHAHALWWTTERPEQWFTFQYYHIPGGGYAAIIAPNLELSANRMKFAAALNDRDIAIDSSISAPLMIFSPSDTTFAQVKAHLGPIIDVGLTSQLPQSGQEVEHVFWLKGLRAIDARAQTTKWSEYLAKLYEEYKE